MKEREDMPTPPIPLLLLRTFRASATFVAICTWTAHMLGSMGQKRAGNAAVRLAAAVLSGMGTPVVVAYGERGYRAIARALDHYGDRLLDELTAATGMVLEEAPLQAEDTGERMEALALLASASTAVSLAADHLFSSRRYRQLSRCCQTLARSLADSFAERVTASGSREAMLLSLGALIPAAQKASERISQPIASGLEAAAALKDILMPSQGDARPEGSRERGNGRASAR